VVFLNQIIKTGTAAALVGLLLTFIGAWVTASGVIMSKKTATELASTKWDLNVELRDSLLSQSRKAKWGLILITIGTGFQIISVCQQIRNQ
jgi:hypothetical protein